MLHWLAGQKPTEDGDVNGHSDPPETPAPVFAVRAFKHALFGTPQTQANPRRYSNTENARPKIFETKPLRPNMNRPKSSGDTYTIAKQENAPVVEPLASPTKGILMTPGTAAARKKNVTFGDHVVDNEGKRPLKGGVPDDCPGKFPSQFNKDSDDPKRRDDSPDKGKGRSKLTEAFELARDESKKRKPKDKRGWQEEDEDNDLITEPDPLSETGKYWKHEYDIYRERTEREVRKLITKQKAAKSFALAKDTQCTELADQLKHEQQKVDGLEAKTAELAAQMKDLQDKLRISQDADKRHKEEIAILKRQLGRRDSARPGSSGSATGATAERPMMREQTKSQDNLVRKSPERPKAMDEQKEDPVQRPSEPYNPVVRTEAPTLRSHSHAKTRPENVNTTPSEDIWAPSLASSSAVATRSAGRPPVAPMGQRTVTSGTDATPLKTLSINTMASGRDPKATGSSPQSLEVECKSMPDIDRVDDQKRTNIDSKQKETPPGSPSLPLPSPEAPFMAKPVSTQRGEKMGSPSSQVPFSSPFMPDAKGSPVRAPRALPPLPPTHNTKENIAPVTKQRSPPGELSTKPSAIWSSIGTPQQQKRNTSMTGKDGKEVPIDRLEAARARIAARGRVSS